MEKKRDKTQDKKKNSRPGIVDIAKNVGVSTATVSRALGSKGRVSEKTRKKVLDKAKSLGYSPNINARNLITKKPKALAFFYPSLIEGEPNYFIGEITLGINEAATEKGLVAHMFPFHVHEELRDVDFLRDSILNGGVSGIIVVEADKASDFLFETARSAGVPAVEISPGAKAKKDTVTFDIEKGAELAGKHLREIGAERPAYIAGIADAQKRIGFSKGLGDLAKELIKDWGGSTFHDGALAFERLDPENSGVDAVFCANDILAMGFIRAALTHGFDVPGDIAVVGCDDVRISQYYYPALTTIRLNPIEIGRSSVEILETMVEGKKKNKGRHVECDLIVRESA